MKTGLVYVALPLILCICACDVSSESGMVHIPSGTFIMGGKSNQAEPDEFPNRTIHVSAFLMDETEVTNSQFKAFIDASGYETTAERAINWDELSKQLPPSTPKPPDSLLLPGALVFRSSNQVKTLDDYTQWWAWTVGADWKHPEGPGSDLTDRWDHPVVNVTWEDAQAYAKWAGKRLPTEAEWEWASMGGIQNAIYPWGNESPESAYTKANFWQGIFPISDLALDGFHGTSPVKSFPPNGYGLYDMGGNVWELCYDKYHFNSYQINQTESNPEGPDSSFDPREPNVLKYVTRGGSFLCNDSYCSGYRTSRRMGIAHDTGINHTGFRCVKSLDN